MATKQLARQLGIIQSVSKPSPGGQSYAQPKLRQLFDYLIVIDFESTCWKEVRKYQEIIEFPAVLLNTSNGEIETEFHVYIQPQEHPTLSEFCIELTGIKQNQVDEGVPLHICLSQFSKWIQKIQKEKNIVFGSACAAPEEKLCAFVTWSDWDLGICLHYECKRKQLRKPDILNSWIDLRATYKNFYSRKPQGLNGALKDVGITFEGREHSGLDDSRNTARLAWKMIRDGCVMKITKSLDKAPPVKTSIARFWGEKPTKSCPSGTNRLVKALRLGESENEVATEIRKKEGDPQQEMVHLGLHEDTPLRSGNSRKTDEHCSNEQKQTSSFGRLHWPLGYFQHPSYKPLGLQSWGDNGHLISNPSMCNQGLVLVPTTLSTVNVSETDISTTPDCLSLLADWEDVAIIPEREDDPNSESWPSRENPPHKSSLVTDERENRNKLNGMNWGAEKGVDAPLSTELSKSIIYKSPDTTIYNAGRAPNNFSDISSFKLPVVMTDASSNRNPHACPTEAIKRKPSSPKSFPPNKKTPFRIYEDGRPTSSSFLPPKANLCSVLPAPLNSSSNFSQSLRAAETGRMTPPLCQCGRRARKLNVSKGGPNQGKAFYSCPVRKREGNRKGCNYFQWEHSLLKEKIALPTLASGAVGLKPLKIQCTSLGNVKSKSLGLRPSMRT